MYGIAHPMKGKTFDEFYGIEKSHQIKEKIKKNAKPFWSNKKLQDSTKLKISETLKERFKNKENHPLYGKKLSKSSKKKISDTLIKYYQENPKIISDETKKKQSISASGNNNSSFTIYTIKNIETSEIVMFKGSNELKKFITQFKKEKGLGKTNPPSFNLLIKGKNTKYFSLIQKYYPNRKN